MGFLERRASIGGGAGMGVMLALATVGLALAAAFGGCRRVEVSGRAGLSDTPVVATVGGTPVYASAVAIQMHRHGIAARPALEQLVTFELLARAAAAAGVEGDDPQSLQLAKVQRLIEREIEPRLTWAAIDDSEVRAVYDHAKTRFVHGRLVQTALLCLFTGARMKQEPRARVEANARLLQAFLHSHPVHSAAEFEAISKDPTWIDRKVSLTTVWQESDQPFPAVVGTAVQALSRPGQITDLVGDETGIYIGLYLSEKAPANVSLAEASPEIRREMFEPWRRQKFLQLSLAMAQGHDIEVFPEHFRLMSESEDSARAADAP